MDKTVRKKIQMRIRKMLKKTEVPGDVDIPDKGDIYKDDDFEITFLGYKLSFRDCKMDFEAKDLKSGITYHVDLTEYIRTERPYWYIKKKER